MTHPVSRREFLAATGAGLTAAAFGAGPAHAQAGPGTAAQRPPVVVFSKHLQHLNYAALAIQCKRLGLDGVDLTVRPGGHVEPARVAEDLPRAVEAIREQGLDVPMITTRLTKGDDPTARPVLEAASKLGIKYFRIGGQKYDRMGYPIAHLDRYAIELAGLASLAEELGMVAGYHNHSGENYVGAPVWDLFYLFNQVNSPALGSNFDVGHATVEGAYGDWQITARLMARHVKMIAVKDFVWSGDRPRWVQLGGGVVKTAEFFKIFRAANFNGPVSMHFEYDTRDNRELVDHIEAAAAHVRACLDEAGYA